MSVRLVGIDALLRKMQPDYLVAPAAHDMLERAGSEGERVARDGAPDSVAARMHTEVSSFHAEIVSMHPASAAIEAGRRPGAPMPPESAIAAWAGGRLPRRAAWLIARAIGRRGIRGRFFMRAAAAHLRRRSRDFARDAANDIERRWRS